MGGGGQDKRSPGNGPGGSTAVSVQLLQTWFLASLIPQFTSFISYFKRKQRLFINNSVVKGTNVEKGRL